MFRFPVRKSTENSCTERLIELYGVRQIEYYGDTRKRRMELLKPVALFTS
jgi:hypothetical protein